MPATDPAPTLLDSPSRQAALTRLRDGQELAFELPTPRAACRRCASTRDASTRVDLALDGDKIREKVIERPIERRIVVAAAPSASSLYPTAPASRADRQHDQHARQRSSSTTSTSTKTCGDGDTFQVVYEETWRDGQRIGTGGVIGATFTNRGKRYTALPLRAATARPSTSTDDGRPLKKSCMRMPIEFARLSSTFGTRRHPVLGRMRMHKGVDYAARTGTPIMAAGDARSRSSAGRTATAAP